MINPYFRFFVASYCHLWSPVSTFQITFVPPVQPFSVFRRTHRHLCLPGCHSHRPTVTQMFLQRHLCITCQSDTSGAQLGALCCCAKKETRQITLSSSPLFLCALLDSVLPHQLCPSVHLSAEQGEEEVKHAYAGTQTLTGAVNMYSTDTHTQTAHTRITGLK